MATKVVMEALSPTMEEGRLVEWKKNTGDTIAVGDVLAEVETDKAVMELVARAAGTLISQAVAAGATVPVASVVAWIGAAGEAIPGGAAPAPAAAAPPEPTPAASVAADRRTEKPAVVTEATPGGPGVKSAGASARVEGEAEPPAASVSPSAAATPPGDSASPSATDGRVKASPLARRMAADKGLDLSGVAGSGPEGRIIKRDVEQASTAVRSTEGRPAARVETGEAFADVPLSQMRKAIAKRLVQSIGPIPTYYLTAEADMERAHEAREALLAKDEKGKFSFNDFVIRAAASALRLHPWVNAWWLDDRVRQWHEVHIGVAVAIDEGLITPVIRHADQKTLREIAGEVRELAGRAREKKLKPEEYTGATFSISNLGMFGIDEFTAIINPPEAAILAVGRMEPKAVVIDGAVVVRRRMRITMSCDHRVIDGATGAAFLKTLVGMLENPLALVW
jgi:pyruvate dehydrogenase E2 component (dihydrolipoamide acetyltransferase)